MQFEISQMRTQVSRRTLGLLLACGLTPIVVLAAIAYYGISTRLVQLADDQLVTVSQSDKQLVSGRIRSLVSTLQGPIDSVPLAHGNIVFTPTGPESRGYFDAVLVEASPDRVSRALGVMPSRPVLSDGQVAQLRQGRPVLVLGEASGPKAFFLVTATRAGAEYPRAWGHARFIAAFHGMEASPSDGGFCIYAVGVPLHCRSDADAAPLPAGVTEASGMTRWKNHGAAIVTAFHRVDPDSAATAPWYVVRSAPEAAALAPLVPFRNIFIFGTLFATVGLILIGLLLANRRATPLTALTVATEQLRGGDYSARIEATANPEFEALTDSFNQMASELDRHFVTAEALQRVADAVLVERSTAALITSVSHHLPELLTATAVTVVAAVSDDPLHWRGEVTAHNRAAPEPIDLLVAKPTIGALRLAPEWSVLKAGEPLPEYCAGLAPHSGAVVVVFPLLRSGRPFGVLAAALLPGVAPHPRLLAAGRQFATQLARGLTNVAILEDLELQSTGTLTALARSIDAASRWTAGHSERVARTAVEIARRAGMDEKAQTLLRRGALVHDIGKLGVPSTILDRPGQLTDDEQSTIETHPLIGAEMILTIPAFREILPLVQHHHELLDGSGYPHGLRAEKIPPIVRILTVADVYDALVSDRPYRERMTPEGALGILRRGAGVKYDERVIDALEAMLKTDTSPHIDAVPAVAPLALAQVQARLAEVQRAG